MNHELQISPVAYIRTGFSSKFGIPRQSGLADHTEGTIVFTPEFRSPETVRELDGFSHIWLIFGFSESYGQPWHPTVRPPRLGGNRRVGVFASRSPFRPNPLGLSCVELDRIEYGEEGPLLHVYGADLLDGTPIYDIKPYLPISDCLPDAKEGYTAQTKTHRLTVDFPESLADDVDPHVLPVLFELLACDPRPGYMEEGSRVFGFSYCGYEIGFTVLNGTAHVCRVEKSPS